MTAPTDGGQHDAGLTKGHASDDAGDLYQMPQGEFVVVEHCDRLAGQVAHGHKTTGPETSAREPRYLLEARRLPAGAVLESL